MEFLKNFLHSLDFFRNPINLLFRFKPKISTSCGVFVSILLYSALLFSFITSDMLLKRNPSISDQLVANDETQILMSTDTLGLAIGLSEEYNEYFTYIDPSYLSIEVYFNDFTTKNKSDVYTFLELQNCSSKNILTPNLSSYYKSFLCLKNTENSSMINFKVNEKTLWESDYSFLSLYLKICSNETSSVPCKPLEEIFDYLHGKYFSIKFFDYFFDLKDYENPGRINAQNSKDFILDKNVYQFYGFSLMKVDILEDSSSIIENGEILKSSYFQQDSSQSSFSFYNYLSDDEFSTLIHCEIYPSLNKREITRKYQKLTDLLSKIGGLASILKLFGSLFVGFFQYLKIVKAISKINDNNNEESNNEEFKGGKLKNEIRKKEIIADEHKKFNVNVSQFTNSIDLYNRTPKDNIYNELKLEEIAIKNKDIFELSNINQKLEKNNQNENNNKIIQKIEIPEFKKTKKKKEKISFFSLMKYKFRKILNIKIDENGKFIEESLNDYNENLDIISIIKQLKDLAKIKLILFNDNQKDLFDLINIKPKLVKNEKNHRLFDYYSEINQGVFTEIDKRLINLYNNNQKNQ